MTTKKYFEQAITLDKRIDSKLEYLTSLRALATKTNSSLNEAPVSGTRNVHRLEDVICKIADLENEINADIDRLVDMKREFTDIIRRMQDPRQQLLMEKRYLCGHTWEEISTEMNYDLRWVYRLHGQALLEAEKHIPGEPNAISQ